MPTVATPTANAITQAALDVLDVKPSEGVKVYAYINHDRWVAGCPCNGAERVAPGQPMLCGSCGAQHEVVFPSKDEQWAIIEQLDKRPPPNRNWRPGETVDLLLAENIDHGIGVL